MHGHIPVEKAPDIKGRRRKKWIYFFIFLLVLIGLIIYSDFHLYFYNEWIN